MDPGAGFANEVIQHALRIFRIRSTSAISGRDSRTLDDILREALRQYFLEKMHYDIQQSDTEGRSHLNQMVESLRPRLNLQITEEQIPCEEAAEAPVHTEPSISGDGEESQSITPPAEPKSTSRSTTETVRPHIHHLEWLDMAQTVLSIAMCCWIYRPFTYLRTGLVQAVRGVRQYFA
ncbi:MAG: hypothetical protein Q9224_007578, partial [Gallowayella concinna]